MDNERKAAYFISEEVRIRQQLGELADMLAVSGKACRHSGLSYGKMGIVVFLFHYFREIHDTFFEDIAIEFINEIQESLHVIFSLGHASGVSGIGTSIEYLAQKDFLCINTDDILKNFDELFAAQINNQKLYLSSQVLKDLKRYFSARLENPQTQKKDFLNTMTDSVTSLLELHYKLSITFEKVQIRKLRQDDPENWGLEGRAGIGLELLSMLNPRHNTWIQLR